MMDTPTIGSGISTPLEEDEEFTPETSHSSGPPTGSSTLTATEEHSPPQGNVLTTQPSVSTTQPSVLTTQSSVPTTQPSLPGQSQQAMESDAGPSQKGKDKRQSDKGQSEEGGESKEERVNLRKLLDNKLSNYKQNNLKKKLPSSEVTAEELVLKRKMVQQTEETDGTFEENIYKLSSIVDKLVGTISMGFTMLQKIVAPVEPPPQPQLSAPHLAPFHPHQHFSGAHPATPDQMQPLSQPCTPYMPQAQPFSPPNNTDVQGTSSRSEEETPDIEYDHAPFLWTCTLPLLMLLLPVG